VIRCQKGCDGGSRNVLKERRKKKKEGGRERGGLKGQLRTPGGERKVGWVGSPSEVAVSATSLIGSP